MCVEIGRGVNSGTRHEDIEKGIELVMGGSEEGVEMRNKALGVKEMIKDDVCEDEGFKGSSIKAIEEFVGAASKRRE